MIIISSILLAGIIFVALYFALCNFVRSMQLKKKNEEQRFQQMTEEITKTVHVQYINNSNSQEEGYTIIRLCNLCEDYVICVKIRLKNWNV